MWNDLPRRVRCHADERGTLVAWEAPAVPFPMARVFFLVQLPEGAERGGHAHKACHELIVCLSGALRVTLRTPTDERSFVLEGPDQGLHVPPGHWIDLKVLTGGTVVAVACSHPYEEADYLRRWEDFVAPGKR